VNLESILIVAIDSLPITLNSISNIAFSNTDLNTFYAVGMSVDAPMTNKIEKFFIEHKNKQGEISSKTIAVLSKPESSVVNYAFSENLKKLVVQSNENKLYVFIVEQSK
jgi:hypothetical protein